jgi:NADH:ubiquinone oxidoreductase subunit C
MNVSDNIRERFGSRVETWHEKSARRIYFSVKKEDIVPVVEFLFKELHCRFSTASGVELAEGFEILYHFSHDKTGAIYSVRVFLNRDQLEIDSITPLFVGAEWSEREMWEMLGINFKGHPNLTRLLLAEDWPQGNYPLRKEGGR